MPVVNFKESEYLLPYLKPQISGKSHYYNTISANKLLAVLNHNTATQYNLILKIIYTIKFSTNQKHRYPKTMTRFVWMCSSLKTGESAFYTDDTK